MSSVIRGRRRSETGLKSTRITGISLRRLGTEDKRKEEGKTDSKNKKRRHQRIACITAPRC